MTYKLQISVGLPKTKLINLLKSQEDLASWQPELQSFELVSGEPGQEGARTILKYIYGKRLVEMTEEILRVTSDETIVYYEATGAKNWVTNRFVVLNENTTMWILESEFKCSGFLKLLTILNPGMFKKQTWQSMERFKDFAESKFQAA